MAYIMRTMGVSILDQNLSQFANVDYTVGPAQMGGINLTSDVQLVQFFLLWIIQEVPPIRLTDRYGLPIKTLRIDGIFGPRTYDAIKSFQVAVRDNFEEDGVKASIACDGLVDPANAMGVATISGTVYTIVWMNGLRQALVGSPVNEDQTSIEPLRSSLREVRGDIDPAPSPNPLPPPPPPPMFR